MAAFSQEKSPLKVFTPLPENTLLASRIYGNEKLGGSFEFTVQLIAQKSTTIDFGKLLGQCAHVEILLVDGKKRHIHGEIAEFSQMDGDEQFDHYSMVLRPRLARLGLVRRSRIFQNLNGRDILRTVLSTVGQGDFTNVLKDYPIRIYCTQYRETDQEFFLRICSDAGINHFWVHSENDHKLMLTDTTSENAPDLGEIRYDNMVGGSISETLIRSWRLTQKQCPTSGSILDNHFQLFKQQLNGSANGPQTVSAGQVSLATKGPADAWQEDELSASRFFDELNSSGNIDSEAPSNMHNWQERKARTLASAAASTSIRASATSDCCRMAPGHTFKLTNHPNQNGDWLVVAVDHRVEVKGNFWSDEPSEVNREAIAQCAPLALQQLHWPLIPRPKVGGVQTALVIGPEKQEIFIDPYGRVQVKFWWDREESSSSCWLRVAQVWAGNGWGASFWPRVGNEVVVAFEHGDPDRPLVIGSAYNSGNMPPFELPANKYIAGWKSLTENGDPSKNYHQILMSDEKGAEVVHIHAESMFVAHQESQQFNMRPKLDVNFQG